MLTQPEREMHTEDSGHPQDNFSLELGIQLLHAGLKAAHGRIADSRDWETSSEFREFLLLNFKTQGNLTTYVNPP